MKPSAAVGWLVTLVKMRTRAERYSMNRQNVKRVSWNWSTLFTINSGRQMKLDNKKHFAACTAAQNITTYYNNYNTDSPRSYTVTKTFVFFLIKQLESSIPK